MKEEKYIIFDINSSEIVCVCAKKHSNGAFEILKNLKNKIDADNDNSLAINNIDNKDKFDKISKIMNEMFAKIKILGKFNKDVVVGMPNEYCVLETSNATKVIGKEETIIDLIKLKDTIVPDIEESNGELYTNFFNTIAGYTVSNEEYGKGRKKTRNRLDLHISRSFCDKIFLLLIKNIVENNGYTFKPVISGILSAKYLLTKIKRSPNFLMLCCEEKNTTFMIGNCNTIKYMKVCNIGMESITNKVFSLIKKTGKNISYETSKKLLNSAVLTLNDKDTKYKVGEDDFPVFIINREIKICVNELINKMIDFIKEVITEENISIKNTIYLLGNGITKIDGLKNYIEYCLDGSKIEILKPDLPQMNKTELCFVVSLLSFAMDNKLI